MGALKSNRYKYIACVGSTFTDEDAEIIGPELKRIGEADGGQSSPQSIVDSARNKRSPIHRYFDWDDESAGEKWRLSQARHMVRSILVNYEIKRGDTVSVRAFHSVSDKDNGRKYVSLESVLTEKDFLEQVVHQARRELAAWAFKYRTYKSLKKQVRVVEKLVGELSYEPNWGRERV